MNKYCVIGEKLPHTMSPQIHSMFFKSMGIEGEYIGVGHVALGYPDGEIAAPKPRKSDWIYRV